MPQATWTCRAGHPMSSAASHRLGWMLLLLLYCCCCCSLEHPSANPEERDRGRTGVASSTERLRHWRSQRGLAERATAPTSDQPPAAEAQCPKMIRCLTDEAQIPSFSGEEPLLLFVLTGSRCTDPTATIIWHNVQKILELHPDAHILLTIGMDTKDQEEDSLRGTEVTCRRDVIAKCAEFEKHLMSNRSTTWGHLEVLFFEKRSCGAFEVGGIVASMWAGHTAHTYVFMQSHMWIEQRIPEEYFWRSDVNEVKSRGGWGWKDQEDEGKRVARLERDGNVEVPDAPYHEVLHHWRQDRQRRRRGAACGFVPFWHFDPDMFMVNLDLWTAVSSCLKFVLGSVLRYTSKDASMQQ